MKFRMHMGDSLEQILQILHNESSSLTNDIEYPDKRTGKNVDYVNDVLNYLGTLNPEIEFSKPDTVKFSSDHPYRKVFEAIDLINNDLEQLAIERQNNEQFKLDMERKLSTVQKMEALGTLSGGIAHDFNNILSGIFGYSQLIAINQSDSEKIKGYNQKIFQGAQRASSLIQQILSFSRHVKYNKQPICLKNILKEVVNLLHSTIPSNIEIKTAFNSQSKVLADSTQIHQIIMNLCTNAYQSMRDEGGTMKLELDEEKLPKNMLKNKPKNAHEKYLKLSVSDTGSGIENHIKEKIFDPYFTTKEVDSGTGLAVVAGIVKKHNGFIDLDTVPGRGSTFQVYFPLIDDDFEASIDSTVQKEKQSDGKERIMLVDDEQDILDTLGVILSEKGYRVTTFLNGVSAFEIFAENPNQFDLIISDMTMPKMTGAKLSMEVMKIRADIPFIICTGYNDNFTEEDAIEIGIKKYILKPVIGSELAQIIREILDNDKK